MWQDARDPNRATQCYWCWEYTDVKALTIHPGTMDAKDKFYCEKCMPKAKMFFTEYGTKFKVENDK